MSPDKEPGPAGEEGPVQVVLRDLGPEDVNRLALLASLAERVNRAGTSNSVLRSIIETLVKTFSAERGKLHLFGGQEVSVTSEPSETTFVHSRTVVDTACKDGKAILSFDAIGDKELPTSQSLQTQGIRSVACCPLKGMETDLGWLYLDSRTSTGVFSLNDLELIKVVSGVLAAAIERASYIAETEEKSRRLEVALQALKKANRAKSEFLLTMSHELLTPLATVIGYGKLLQRDNLGSLSEQQNDFVEQILTSSNKLSAIVGDVLTLTQLETGGFALQPRWCDMGEIVRNGIESVRDSAQEKQIDIHFSIGPEPIKWKIDPERFADVIRHLLDNAIKFNTRGGTVKVALGEVLGTLQLQVDDSGIGIPSEAQSRIFERFIQLDSSATRTFGGLGLGLALVERLVAHHGGTVSVISRGVAGEGSTFRVVLNKPKTNPAT